MALAGYQSAALVFGLSPFIIAAVIGLVIAGGWFLERYRDRLNALGYAALFVLVAVMIVAFIVGNVCMAIRPRELFVATAAPTLESLGDRVTALEKGACDLVTRADQFIQNDVGKPGQDDPSLVTAAQEKVRAALPGPIVVCPAAATPLQGLSAEILADLENRVTRLETTLLKFTLPELQRTYDTAVKCEGFVGASASDGISALADRVTALETAIADQKTKLLKPIDDKTAALQRGELSDCDKKKGSKTAIAESNKMPAGTARGV